MKNFFILSTLILFVSCNKNGGCEQWEYFDICEAKTTTKTYAHSKVYGKGPICGKEARHAKVGGTWVMQDDEFFLKTRHYLKTW
ncbi:MAG: hypothetical protein J7497_13355 [Chitinophagaceae bacterium]|nr:hypothetical protein [Chitinophagaceae bacterium]